jgi:hypothetical protein
MLSGNRGHFLNLNSNLALNTIIYITKTGSLTNYFVNQPNNSENLLYSSDEATFETNCSTLSNSQNSKKSFFSL